VGKKDKYEVKETVTKEFRKLGRTKTRISPAGTRTIEYEVIDNLNWDSLKKKK